MGFEIIMKILPMTKNLTLPRGIAFLIGNICPLYSQDPPGRYILKRSIHLAPLPGILNPYCMHYLQSAGRRKDSEGLNLLINATMYVAAIRSCRERESNIW